MDSGAVSDAAGNLNADGAEGNNAVTLSVDTAVPVITGVTITGQDSLGSPKSGALKAGDFIAVTVSLSEPVVLTDPGQISYAINVGSFTKFAQFQSLSSDKTQLLLRYTVATGDLEELAGRLSALPEADYVVITAGGFDVLVEVVTEDDEALLELVNKQIRNLPGVLRTETFVYLKLNKQTYTWGTR